MTVDDAIDRASRAKRGSPFLNSEQAGAYLKMSARLLRRLRTRGEGPRFRVHARMIEYHIDDLDAWSNARATTRKSDET